MAVVLFSAFWERSFDDPFITYRYAEHLARGVGLVYNPGEHVLSTTTPFYTLMLALLRGIGLDLPLASNAIGCISLAVGGWTLWRLGRLWQSMGVALAGLLLFPTFPHLLLTLGAEACFFLACVLLAFLAYEERRYAATAALLAVATLTRADAVLAGAVIGLDFLLARRERLPWRALLLYVALLVPWFVFAWVYFGAPLPVTLFVKQQQGRMAGSDSFFAGLFLYGRDYWRQVLYWPHFGLAALGVVFGLVRCPRPLLIPGWALLYFAAYSALGVTRYFWYYAPLVPGFVVLIGIGLGAFGELAGRLVGRHAGQWLGTLLAVLMLIVQTRSLDNLRHSNDRRLVAYRTVGKWLAANTPPDASVGTLEVGIIGYYAQRRMIDFAGLIQPEVALKFGPTNSYDDAALWATEHFRPDFLVLADGTLPRLEESLGAMNHCRPVETFSDPAYGVRLSVYGCASTGPS